MQGSTIKIFVATIGRKMNLNKWYIHLNFSANNFSKSKHCSISFSCGYPEYFQSKNIIHVYLENSSNFQKTHSVWAREISAEVCDWKESVVWIRNTCIGQCMRTMSRQDDFQVDIKHHHSYLTTTTHHKRSHCQLPYMNYYSQASQFL